MLFDWFTAGAQALNFLILVWLLKRFLYKPVLDAIDAREKRVALQLADAAAKAEEAERERAVLKARSDQFDQQRDALLAGASQQAGVERQRLLQEARQAADALRAQRQAALQDEMENLQRDIVRKSRDEIFAIARKMLSDLAGITLEERMSEVFVRRLRELSPEAHDTLVRAIQGGPAPVVVRSAFELSPAQQSLIQRAISDSIDSAVKVRFATDPSLISGIELTANGQRVAWNIADHLASLENDVAELLGAPPVPADRVTTEVQTT